MACLAVVESFYNIFSEVFLADLWPINTKVKRNGRDVKIRTHELIRLRKNDIVRLELKGYFIVSTFEEC